MCVQCSTDERKQGRNYLAVTHLPLDFSPQSERIFSEDKRRSFSSLLPSGCVAVLLILAPEVRNGVGGTTTASVTMHADNQLDWVKNDLRVVIYSEEGCLCASN